jgi:hypothetical protein
MTTQRFTTRAMNYDNPTARCRSLAPVRYTAAPDKALKDMANMKFVVYRQAERINRSATISARLYPRRAGRAFGAPKLESVAVAIQSPVTISVRMFSLTLLSKNGKPSYSQASV